MKAKERLERLLESYFTQRDTMREELRALRLDTVSYEPEEQARLIQAKETAMGIATERLCKDVDMLMQGVIAGQANRKAQDMQKQSSTAYLLARSGALEMIRLGAGKMTAEQICQTAEPFCNDPAAMAAFRGALTACGYDDRQAKDALSSIKSSDELTVMLEQLLSNLLAAVTLHPVYGMQLERASVLMLLEGWNADLTRNKAW